MIRARNLLALATVHTIGLPLVGSVGAQEVTTIRDSAVCANCINLQPVVTLFGNDSVALSRSSKAVAFQAGYLVAPTYTPAQVVIYEGDGTLAATFGRRGQGPGEMTGGNTLRIARGPGDSIHVIDRSRWHVFSPAREFVRTTILPAAPLFVAIAPDGMLLGSFPWQAPDGRMFTVSLINSSGRVVRSFDSPQDSEPDDPWTTLRIVDSSENALWTARVNRIEIRRQVLSGDSAPRVWRRSTGWFPGWEGYNGQEPYFARPRAQMTGFSPTRDIMWILAQRADAGWKPLRPPNPSSGGEPPRQMNVDPDKVFDGVIEAVDRTTGRVIATVSTDEVWRPLSGRPAQAQRTRMLDSGEVVIEVVRLVLDVR